jgi:hypothetical protein
MVNQQQLAVAAHGAQQNQQGERREVHGARGSRRARLLASLVAASAKSRCRPLTIRTVWLVPTLLDVVFVPVLTIVWVVGAVTVTS